MKKLLIPIVLGVIGLGAGAGAGLMLRPAPAEDTATDDHAAPAAHGEAVAPGHDAEQSDEHAPEYVKMSNQFIIPLIRQDRIASVVVLSLSLEVTAGHAEDLYAREPKLRDAFLQVLFDHANTGGFDGAFTESRAIDRLRVRLREVALAQMPDLVSDVLITDIGRQDS
ncbi:flagellar basal body-associated FliL family protein [Gemmobacter caeruleus]|uniref:flagellar basal body-associated FliL family protein n=1 Tax=Gemmobacter caeruleus TaxID=2595004 RepID=UPI0011EF63C3|nr:flagellar basal body-associated FliL family protein [Gemmobacter caeruleus]